MTLFEYLQKNRDNNVIDHLLRVEQIEGEGYGARIRFYIHPAAVDGDTPSFTLLSQGCTDVVLQPALETEDDEDESPLEIPSEIAAHGDGLTESVA